jgi:hypothetical protein
MANSKEVMSFLRPNGGWVQVGTDYEGITFESSCEPFTKAEYEAGFAQYDAWKAEQDEALVADRASATAKLEALGLTAEDLAALGL